MPERLGSIPRRLLLDKVCLASTLQRSCSIVGRIRDCLSRDRGSIPLATCVVSVQQGCFGKQRHTLRDRTLSVLWRSGSASPCRGLGHLFESGRHLLFGTLTQSVECLAFNQTAVGSTPTRSWHKQAGLVKWYRDTLPMYNFGFDSRSPQRRTKLTRWRNGSAIDSKSSGHWFNSSTGPQPGF